MTELLKDIEGAARDAAGLRIKLAIIAALAVVLAPLGFGLADHFEQKGRTLERAGWLVKEVKDQAAVAALKDQHEKDMQALELHHQQLARETTYVHQSELETLRLARDIDRQRADAAGGLRILAPACAPGGAVGAPEAASASGRDESAGPATVRLPQQVENDLWHIANDADEVSAQLRACQSWIRRNEFYGPETSSKARLLDRMIAGPNLPGEDTP